MSCLTEPKEAHRSLPRFGKAAATLPSTQASGQAAVGLSTPESEVDAAVLAFWSSATLL